MATESAVTDREPQYLDVPGLQAGAAWHWVSTSGDLVFSSGAIAYDENGELGPDESAAAQTDRAFANLERALKAAGSSLDRIVKVTGYLTDPGTLADVRAVRDRWIPGAPPSTFVFVAGLVDPRLVVEFEAIAIKG